MMSLAFGGSLAHQGDAEMWQINSTDYTNLDINSRSRD